MEYPKVALVTGSESGIGQAVALALAHAGFSVAVCWYLDEEAGERTRTEVEALGVDASLHHLDLEDLPAAADVVDRAAEDLGGLGVLVNCAGVTLRRPALDTTLDQWRRVTAVNLDGPFLLAQRAAALMISAGRGGRIINITSVHESAPRVGAAAYCAAKGGLGMLTKVLAQELGAHSITVNSVAPGDILTNMGGMAGVDPFTVSRPGVPLARPGGPNEVASVVAFLASPASSFVTGASWAVDGGMLLMGPQGGSHLTDGWQDDTRPAPR